MKPEPLKGKGCFYSEDAKGPLIKIMSDNEEMSIEDVAKKFMKENSDIVLYRKLDVKLAVEWYKQWLGLPLEFYNTYPKYEKELNKLFSGVAFITNTVTSEHLEWIKIIENDEDDLIIPPIISLFNEWLLNKAFSDVIET